jgi:hypothetical protein
MPATVTLSSTVLELGADVLAPSIKPLSTDNILPGCFLFISGELMRFIAYQPGGWIKVARGVGGTSAQKHTSREVVWIGRGDQMYDFDPVGRPPDVIPVSPHINVLNGRVWFTQGDATGPGKRWWEEQATTREAGALGVVQESQSPSSST